MKELRLQKAWTQEELSGRSGVGRVFISQVENGHKDICLGVIETFADCFGISIAELMKAV